MRRLRCLIACCVLAAASLAVAERPSIDADTAAARRHFERGRGYYEEGRFVEACGEFEEARRLRAIPALDFNLAKCEERLEHWDRAIAAYERYLASGAVDAEVTKRLETLRERVAPKPPVVTPVPRLVEPPPPAPQPAHPKLRIAAIAVAAAAGAVLIGGTGAYLSVLSDYRAQEDVCRTRPCVAADYPGLADGVRRAQVAGYTLWAIGGALVVADAGLWVLATRPAERPRVWLAPGVGSLTVGGAF